MKNKLTTLSDEDLLQLVSNGNENAFAVIFDRYWKRLYHYTFKIYRDEKVCEDIVQEIFISLWKNSQNTILHLESYLLRAVKYKIANHIRSLKWDSDHLDALEELPTLQKTVNDIEYKELESDLMEKINLLSPKCKEVFLMSRVEYLSNAEIASRLQLSIHTVEKHISNALKELRSHLQHWQYYTIVCLMLL